MLVHLFFKLIDPLSALLLFAWVAVLFAFLLGGYAPAWGASRTRRGAVAFLCFLVVFVVCFFAWAFRM